MRENVLAFAVGLMVFLAVFLGGLYRGEFVVATGTTSNTTIYVFVNPFGRVFISENGSATIEISSITQPVTYLYQYYYAYIKGVAATTTTTTVTNVFGQVINTTTPVYDFYMIFYNKCVGTPCYPVTFNVYNMSGVFQFQVVVDGNTTTNTSTLVTFNESIVGITVGNYSGTYVVRYVVSYANFDSTIATYVMLIPLAFFVALGVRSNLRDSALGMIAYGIFAPWLAMMVGLDYNTYVPVMILAFVVGGTILVLESRS